MSETEGVLVISRDGRRVAYAAGPAGRQQLFIPEIHQVPSRALPGTKSGDGARVGSAEGPAGRQHLFIREIDQFASRAIPETEGVVSAAFAPDGQSIA